MSHLITSLHLNMLSKLSKCHRCGRPARILDMRGIMSNMTIQEFDAAIPDPEDVTYFQTRIGLRSERLFFDVQLQNRDFDPIGQLGLYFKPVSDSPTPGDILNVMLDRDQWCLTLPLDDKILYLSPLGGISIAAQLGDRSQRDKFGSCWFQHQDGERYRVEFPKLEFNPLLEVSDVTPQVRRMRKLAHDLAERVSSKDIGLNIMHPMTCRRSLTLCP
jgi:hypothetical protein